MDDSTNECWGFYNAKGMGMRVMELMISGGDVKMQKDENGTT